ncbi:transcription factor ABORTED MICROSPORES-like [Hibiscus syriacus]|uniref:transcription factor ABORTED MICROSPORES-like n=1 Tax=Hibiscus syriacus TaxID=106335 RepID=UPI00192491B0|nr:transcription factor ABORTED MICROSPORES-like [Hibiscus syriacus]
MRGFDRTVDWLRPFVDSKGLSNGKAVAALVLMSKRKKMNCRSHRSFQFWKSKKKKDKYSDFMTVKRTGFMEMLLCPISQVGLAMEMPLEMTGTQVLIPVLGGLIELFASNHIPKDHSVIELVTSQCNAVLKPELTSAESYTKANLDRCPSIEHPPFASDSAYMSQGEKFKHLIGTHYGTKRPRCSQNVSEQQARFVPDRDESVNNRMRTTEQPEKEKYNSKNFTSPMISLFPNLLMDKPAILTDAIEFVEDLQQEKKKLEKELMEIEDNISAVKPKQVSSSVTETVKTEVHVEVNQITKREFLIKLQYEHKRGRFAKLMEGIDSLGLQVIDANVTTFNEKVLSIFKVDIHK